MTEGPAEPTLASPWVTTPTRSTSRRERLFAREGTYYDAPH